MPPLRFLLAGLWLLMIMPQSAAAHKLNVTAWPSDGEIQGEVASSDGGPADGRNVKIIVEEAKSHAVLLETKTDDAGGFHFAHPASPQDILVIADAGQGHRGELLLPAAADAAPAEKAAAPSVTTVNEELLRRIVAEETARALVPIRRALAEMRERPPSFRDIFGGIGWIFGLAGLLAWFRSRRDK
jgi:nickel transport protein